jgi:hypothetical protein
VAWEIARQYRGPEEGGWWQDWTSILEVRKVYSWEDGLRAARELHQMYPSSRYDRSFLRGTGDTFVGTFYEPELFPKETTERMRYE